MPAVFVTSDMPLLPIAQHRIKELASVIDCPDPSRVTVVSKTDRVNEDEAFLQINVSYLENEHPAISSFCTSVADFVKAELKLKNVHVHKAVVRH